MHRGWVLVLALLAGCTSCTPLVVTVVHEKPPQRAYDAQPLVPEGWYREVHRRLAVCTDVHDKPYDAIEWYVVEEGTMRDEVGHTLVGLFSPENRIYLDSRHVMNWRVVGHEIYHYLTRRKDIGDVINATVAECMGRTP